MPSSNQERQRQRQQQQQQAQQQAQEQQQNINSWPRPECCGHFADAYGNFAVPRSCENEDCNMRGIQTGSFCCPDCNNTKLIWEFCGCEPLLAADTHSYGLANDEQTQAAATNVGRSDEPDTRNRRVSRRGGERRSVDRP
ncbi:hypothetical protein MCOR19_008748 [Pyricularia oryzae]|nr:hypothetical protein MCOR01_008796 [Pyricularia oryzae]KAI6254746.1 hypothetical protein MCOR19_008748 [Pyricularia oryzae]KAI6329502.1 hypothetical protein MCOR30_005543 [Pyricularia oryzae]KAI6440274.1 hypothetical protein MCOR22_007280 [Pyricularia oryzae]KAI6517880.1 hypothetical protein MCOR16_009253 [Pyricularia oryzae]